MNYLNLIFISSFIINIVIIFFTLLNERREPEKTLMWILVLLISGPIGLICYIFFGKDIRRAYLKNKNFYNIDEINKINQKSQSSFNINDRDEFTQITNLVSKLNFCPIMKNSEIKIFSNGAQKFEALKRELNRAKHHIHMEYFIVRDDNIGNEIKNILINKSKQGIKVRFLMDKVGCRKLSKKYINDLKESGVEILFYSYMSTPFLKLINTQINYRNHRKIVVIDGYTSFTGGINIGDEYLGLSSLGKWRDTHLMIKGECTLSIQDVFIHDYLNLKRLRRESIFQKEEVLNYFPKINNSSKETLTQIIKSGPNLSKDNIILPLIKLITSAKKSIRISTPYFIPFTGFINILKTCILSGIEVIINFPGKPDHKLVYHASRTYLNELYNIGCKIYFYDKSSFLHSKFVIIDDNIVTVGSTNMDIRSFELNHELNLIIYDKDICNKFISIFNEDIENSIPGNEDIFKNISHKQIFFENISRLFSSLL